MSEHKEYNRNEEKFYEAVLQHSTQDFVTVWYKGVSIV